MLDMLLYWFTRTFLMTPEEKRADDEFHRSASCFLGHLYQRTAKDLDEYAKELNRPN